MRKIARESRRPGFHVFCLFTPLFRRFRLSRVSKSIDLDETYRLVSKILNFMPCGSVLSRFCVFSTEERVSHGGRVAATGRVRMCPTLQRVSHGGRMAATCRARICPNLEWVSHGGRVAGGGWRQQVVPKRTTSYGEWHAEARDDNNKNKNKNKSNNFFPWFTPPHTRTRKT